jgi:hypothetical protein
VVLHSTDSQDLFYNSSILSASSATSFPVVTLPVTVLPSISPAVLLRPSSLSMEEGGGAVEYTVAVATAPSSTVCVAIGVEKHAQAELFRIITTPDRLCWNVTHWRHAQVVLVRVKNNAVASGVSAVQLVLNHIVSGGDGAYTALPPALLPVTVLEDDSAAVLLSLQRSISLVESRNNGSSSSSNVNSSSGSLSQFRVSLLSLTLGEGTQVWTVHRAALV